MISAGMIWVMLIVGIIIFLVSSQFFFDSKSKSAGLISGIIVTISGITIIASIVIGVFRLVSEPISDAGAGYRYEETIYEENTVVALKDSLYSYEKGNIEARRNSVLFFITTTKVSGEYESGEKYVIRCMIEDKNGIIEMKEFDMDDIKLKRGENARAYKEIDVYCRNFDNAFARWLFVEDNRSKDKQIETGKWIFEVPEDSLYTEINIDLE